jgi:hypothetical protein
MRLASRSWQRTFGEAVVGGLTGQPTGVNRTVTVRIHHQWLFSTVLQFCDFKSPLPCVLCRHVGQGAITDSLRGWHRSLHMRTEYYSISMAGYTSGVKGRWRYTGAAGRAQLGRHPQQHCGFNLGDASSSDTGLRASISTTSAASALAARYSPIPGVHQPRAPYCQVGWLVGCIDADIQPWACTPHCPISGHRQPPKSAAAVINAGVPATMSGGQGQAPLSFLPTHMHHCRAAVLGCMGTFVYVETNVFTTCPQPVCTTA